MFALVKPFLIALAIIFFLLYAIGVVRFEKASYACYKGKKVHFAKRVLLSDIGGLKVYGYPLVADCPADERYDPKTVFKCGYQEFCQKDDTATIQP